MTFAATNMKLKILFTAILLILTNSDLSHSATKKSVECKKVTDKIESIQKKMRGSYSTKQAAQYNKQLNNLYKKQFKTCFWNLN